MTSATTKVSSYMKDVGLLPEIKVDFRGSKETLKVNDLGSLVSQAKIASAAIYIKGDPGAVRDAVADLAGRGYAEINATISLRGDDAQKP